MKQASPILLARLTKMFLKLWKKILYNWKIIQISKILGKNHFGIEKQLQNISQMLVSFWFEKRKNK